LRADSIEYFAGTTFAPVKFRSVVEHDTGIRRQVEVPKRIKSWVFTTETGKTAIAVRYGARVLELAKGKFAVEVPSPAQLIPTLELIKTAIDTGELDEQLEATAGSVKAGFKRGTCWRRLNFDHLCRLNLDQGLLLV
jgi:hypothetical protein